MNYGKSVKLTLDFSEAVPKVKEAFAAQGFGTLTEIDVQATLQAKIGVDMEPYLILGACNPQLAPPGPGGDPGYRPAAALQRGGTPARWRCHGSSPRPLDHRHPARRSRPAAHRR